MKIGAGRVRKETCLLISIKKKKDFYRCKCSLCCSYLHLVPASHSFSSDVMLFQKLSVLKLSLFPCNGEVLTQVTNEMCVLNDVS